MIVTPILKPVKTPQFKKIPIIIVVNKKLTHQYRKSNGT